MHTTADPLFIAAEVAYRRERLSHAGRGPVRVAARRAATQRRRWLGLRPGTRRTHGATRPA